MFFVSYTAFKKCDIQVHGQIMVTNVTGQRKHQI